jgi:hypothetical protein
MSAEVSKGYQWWEVYMAQKCKILDLKLELKQAYDLVQLGSSKQVLGGTSGVPDEGLISGPYCFWNLTW